ncbi:MAG: HAD family phosphatase [Muribaculaceae bacterium]|nr:HAD family phosphatase [Muribaculaceae bacterium]MDE6755213.1 HAD family phosphatase [Muribaculaceae bacterium]
MRNFAFLFDLDGVLIDSEKEYSRIWRIINTEYPTGFENLETLIKGCTLDKILTDYYPDQEIREKVTSRLYELEAEMNYSYLPGAENLLNELKIRGIPRVLVTSSNVDKMKHLSEEIPDLPDKFNSIVTANLVTKSKPDPEGYLLAGKLAETPMEKCFVFEDSLQGVKAGHAAGAMVVGVSGTLPAEVLSPYCNLVVNSLEEINLDELISKLSKDDK